MIYLASPYSHKDHEVMENRFVAAREACAFLTKAGKLVYSPIVHWHPVAEAHDLPRDFLFWSKLNFSMIRRCEEVHVLCLNNWNNSLGVSAEIEFAKSAFMNVHYVEPETVGVTFNP